jgi:hypothetical protein
MIRLLPSTPFLLTWPPARVTTSGPSPAGGAGRLDPVPVVLEEAGYPLQPIAYR